MIVYHGATQIIERPDAKHSKRYLDFGPGFYLTSFEEQAKKWAFRKGLRQEKLSFVNVYELKDNLEKYRVLSFDKENERWLVRVEEERTLTSYMILLSATLQMTMFSKQLICIRL